jgi:hypothetical protein
MNVLPLHSDRDHLWDIIVDLGYVQVDEGGVIDVWILIWAAGGVWEAGGEVVGVFVHENSNTFINYPKLHLA